MREYTTEEKAAILAGWTAFEGPDFFDVVLATHTRETLVLAASFVRVRLAAIEAEITRRPDK